MKINDKLINIYIYIFLDWNFFDTGVKYTATALRWFFLETGGNDGIPTAFGLHKLLQVRGRFIIIQTI